MNTSTYTHMYMFEFMYALKVYTCLFVLLEMSPGLCVLSNALHVSSSHDSLLWR